jgi:glycosyltransferase involved in cell wall biosynthesis
MAKCAQSSSLFGHSRIEVIPNGLDLKRYMPHDKKQVRKLFNLPEDKKIILCGAINNLAADFKGFHYLIPALKIAAESGWQNKAELVVLGSSEPTNAPDVGLKTTYLGHLHDDISLSQLYSAADVFVAPYVQDNLPNAVIEAMACGTPTVAFDAGGVPDLIDHARTGYLARPFEIEDLAHGIQWVLEKESRLQSLSIQTRIKAEKEFDIQIVSRRYAQLYTEIVANGKL